MNSSTFKNIARLLEKWPVDQSKKGRDFGEYLRHHIGTSFSGQQTQIDYNSWDEIHVILSRIASNQYKTQYPVSKSVSATGLSGEDSAKAISNEFIQLLQEEDQKAGLKKFFRVKMKSSD